jgi:DNA-binding NtrC family response regulator
MAELEQRTLMLIDDEPAQCRLIMALAAREGWRTLVVKDSETAIATLGTRQGMQLSAIILDQWVPGDNACELIAELKSRRPALPILMLTTSASPLLAVEAMRAGATDYLVKPVAPDRLMLALRAATTREAPRDELAPLTEKMSANPDFESMVGAAPTPLRACHRRQGGSRTYGGADRRRKRHRQGNADARDARRQPAFALAAAHRQCRGHAGQFDRINPVWP